MNLPLRSMDIGEVALLFSALRGNGDWIVLVVEPGADVHSIADEFAEETEMLAGFSVRRISEMHDASILSTLVGAEKGALVISGLDAWESSEWAHLDHLRSRLARHERTALVMEEKTFQRIMQEAPNFSSWLGANVVQCKKVLPILTAEERERRLVALREWSGLSDSDVITRAEAQVLPSDPEYAEWLVLLRRGDLLNG